jgi:hypothetical protein
MDDIGLAGRFTFFIIASQKHRGQLTSKFSFELDNL